MSHTSLILSTLAGAVAFASMSFIMPLPSGAEEVLLTATSALFGGMAMLDMDA